MPGGYLSNKGSGMGRYHGASSTAYNLEKSVPNKALGNPGMPYSYSNSSNGSSLMPGARQQRFFQTMRQFGGDMRERQMNSKLSGVVEGTNVGETYMRGLKNVMGYLKGGDGTVQDMLRMTDPGMNVERHVI